MTLKSAVTAIEKNGILLVYPIDNREQPPSLWSCFYPKSKMKWEWDSGGDHRVSDLWHLREELSRSGKVVYAKWYQGRATFFSKKIFTSLLVLLNSTKIRNQDLHFESRNILELLAMDSPLSTKQIKKMTDLRGKALEPVYTKSLKELWNLLLIVGFGEVHDGAFPSLSIGATQLLFEDLWNDAKTLHPTEADRIVRKILPPDSLFLKPLDKCAKTRDIYLP